MTLADDIHKVLRVTKAAAAEIAAGRMRLSAEEVERLEKAGGLLVAQPEASTDSEESDTE